jgi:hypothetical protein
MITEYTSLGVHDPWVVLTAATVVSTNGIKTTRVVRADVDCVEK